MCRGDQPAEIGVALGSLDEQRHVREVGQRHFRTGDRTHAEVLRRMRELERSVHPVVIGQRERRIAELGSLHGELLRERGAVEERVRGVRVQLHVARPSLSGKPPGFPEPLPPVRFADRRLRRRKLGL